MALNVALASSQHRNSSEAACEEPWVDASAAGMGCLRLDENTRLGWEESQAACSLLGGKLLEWTESAHFDALNDILVKEFHKTGVASWWVGGTDGAEEGTWTWAKSSEKLPSDFAWGWRQPDMGSDANCLALSDDWNDHFLGDDVACAERLAHLCQRLPSLPLPTPPPPPVECSAGWADLSAAGMGCLNLDLEHRLDWDASQTICAAQGGKLLDWKDSANFGILDDLLQDTLLTSGASTWWIGGTDRAEEGKWIWASSAEELPSNFPWTDGQPRESLNNNCLVLQSERPRVDNFMGRDRKCSDSLSHLCQQLPA